MFNKYAIAGALCVLHVITGWSADMPTSIADVDGKLAPTRRVQQQRAMDKTPTTTATDPLLVHPILRPQKPVGTSAVAAEEAATPDAAHWDAFFKACVANVAKERDTECMRMIGGSWPWVSTVSTEEKETVTGILASSTASGLGPFNEGGHVLQQLMEHQAAIQTGGVLVRRSTTFVSSSPHRQRMQAQHHGARAARQQHQHPYTVRSGSDAHRAGNRHQGQGASVSESEARRRGA